MQGAASVAERFALSPRAVQWRLRDTAPYVCGYAWRNPSPRAVIILLHGLQSHAQWFAEGGAMLRDRGFAVYALDRSGSGSSPGERGDVSDYHDWFAEVADLVDNVRSEVPGVPVHLVGHCFGANIALGYALSEPWKIASIAALTPGLFVLPDYSLSEKLRIAVSAALRPRARFRVPQDDHLFTRDKEVLAWIKADRDGSKSVTARCLLQTNRMLGHLRRDLRKLSVPLLVLEAARDRLSDNKRNRTLMTRVLGDRCTWRAFDAEHFLLAEPCRDDVLDTLAEWTADTVMTHS